MREFSHVTYQTQWFQPLSPMTPGEEAEAAEAIAMWAAHYTNLLVQSFKTTSEAIKTRIDREREIDAAIRAVLR